MKKTVLAVSGLATLVALTFAHQFIAARHPGVSVPTAITSCIPCHMRVRSEADGITAARFSKGTHPINADKIRPGKLSLDAKACTGCHRAEHSTWAESLHARSFTNTVFRHALTRDKEAWCLNCHAPLWSGKTEDIERIVRYIADLKTDLPPLPAHLEQGINCQVCHVRDGQIIGSGKKARDATGAKHPVLVDKNLRSEKFCAGCHQFNFPAEMKPVVVYHREPAMQNVVGEHLSLRKYDSDKRCVDCHYKAADHSLHQTSFDDMRKKFSATVRRATEQNPRNVSYTIRTPPIGHHFPTGDLFRAVKLTIFGAAGEVLWREDFRKEVRVIDQELVSDTTLKPVKVGEAAAITRTVALPGNPIRCELTYHLQANIEPTLEKEGSLKPFIRKLAPCRIE